jgi:hypothetical protein
MVEPATAPPSFVTGKGNLTYQGQRQPSVWDSRYYVTVPYVSPEGHFEVQHFDIRKNTSGEFWKQQRGINPLEFRNGRVTLSRIGEARGFVLYRDVCNGTAVSRVGLEEKTVAELHPGVDHRQHWAMWERYCQMQLQGRPIQRSKPAPSEEGAPVSDMFGARFYHPEVLRRREQQKRGGAMAVDADSAITFLMGDGFDPLDPSTAPPAPAIDPTKMSAPITEADVLGVTTKHGKRPRGE